MSICFATRAGSTGRLAIRSKGPSRAEAGGLLMETAVALALFAIVGTAVLVGLSTTHRSGAITESLSMAENLARNQMESAFAQSYLTPPGTYPPITPPPGYSVTAAATQYVAGDPNIETITVTVTYSGRAILVLETLRVIN